MIFSIRKKNLPDLAIKLLLTKLDKFGHFYQIF